LRARFKDRINKKNWSIVLGGQNRSGSATTLLYLTDDSNTTQATSTVAGPRYNIVSGSDGNAHSASTWKTYGWFYPDMGAMVFSQAELSASIPGVSNVDGTHTASYAGYVDTTRITASFQHN
jgi:hypothetical protein